ncbi:MAG TPA: nucleotidyl transferase AbiEii/AbiGii toxin family protein [Anaerolineales bacterium]|nr:nucleotidyl transferase AbiEii/AbiGii toxin family protein [Anaerolineales bacterium]
MKLPRELQKYHDPLVSLQKLISRFNHQGVVIGGLAASVLGEARYTEDIDVMFLLSIQDIPRFLEEAKEEGIEPRIENAADFAKKARILLLRHIITNTNIDVSLGVMPFEQEVVERSSVHEFDDTLQVRLPTPEDLIIMKAIAHRPIDLEDIRTLAMKYINLDLDRIKFWIRDFGEALDAPQLWDQIEHVLKSAN